MNEWQKDTQSRIHVGTFLMVDNWKLSTQLTANDWDGAEWRIESASFTDVTYSVNVKITGRTTQYNTAGFTSAIRVLVTFKDEIGEDVHARGWVNAGTLLQYEYQG